MSGANEDQLNRLVICDHVNSRSEYCDQCSHGRPHEDLIGCSERKETCKARRVGKTVCVELAENKEDMLHGSTSAGLASYAKPDNTHDNT